jgi:hypothetical protein
VIAGLIPPTPDKIVAFVEAVFDITLKLIRLAIGG